MTAGQNLNFENHYLPKGNKTEFGNNLDIFMLIVFVRGESLRFFFSQKCLFSYTHVLISELMIKDKVQR